MLKQFSHYSLMRTIFNLFEISLHKINTIENAVFINKKPIYIPFIEFPFTQSGSLDLGWFSKM